LKIKNIIEFLGVRGRAKRYGYRVERFTLRDGTALRFAQWLHPSARYEPITDDLIDGYRSIVRPGDFCIDIGAHAGDTTLPMAVAAGPTGCVLALEPNPFVYHVLEKNARANREIANIQTLMAAAGPKECFMRFEYSDSGFCNGGRHEGIGATAHGHAYPLEVFAVDTAAELRDDYADWLPRLRLVKIDAEGFDLHVVESLADVIREFRPCVKAEVYKKTSTDYRKNLLSFFLDLDYAVHKIDREPLEPGPRLGLDDVDAWKHYDILCVPGESASDASDSGKCMASAKAR